jgi:hypothetical protein
VDVEQEVGLVDEGPELARSAQFDRVARPEQHLVGPHAIEILVDAARGVRIVEVEAPESRPAPPASLRLPVLMGIERAYE